MKSYRFILALCLFYALNVFSNENDSTRKSKCDFYSKNYLNIGSTHAPVIFFSRLLFGGEINEKNKGNLKPVNHYRRTGGEAQYLFGLSIKLNEKKIDSYYVEFQQLATFGGKYHQELYNLILDGNSNLDQVTLSKNEFHFRNYQLLHGGIEINSMRFGLVLGNMLTENTLDFKDDNYIRFDEDYLWEVSLSSNVTSLGNTNSLFEKNGQLLGLDWEIKEKVNDKWNWGVGVQNLGLLIYNNNTNFYSMDSTFIYEGLSYQEIINFNTTADEFSSNLINEQTPKNYFSMTPFSTYGHINYSHNNTSYSADIFYRHNSQFFPRLNLTATKILSEKFKIGSNLTYGGYTTLQIGSYMQYSLKNFNVNLHLMNLMGLIPSWGKSFGLGIQMNLAL